MIMKGIIINTPIKYSEHFRDPKIFAGKNKDFFLVIGAQTKQTKLGAIALYHSFDGENWQYMRSLATSNTYQMIECPDMFRMGDKYILFYCPQYCKYSDKE